MAAVIEITTLQDFHGLVDEIGDLQVEAQKLKAKIKNRLNAANEWALQHRSEAFGKGASGKTTRYDYRLEAVGRQLKRQGGISEADVIALLKASETMREYVYEAINREALRDAFGGNADNRESIREYGLCFTEPAKDNLKVG